MVLAGGSSRRLGADKTELVLIRDRRAVTLVEWGVTRLAATCGTVVVAAGRNAGCSRPDLEAVPDGAGAGPIAGILGAADRHADRSLFVLACDLPKVPTTTITALIDLGTSSGGAADLVVPIGARGPEPLCALYGPAAIERLRRRADRGQHALHDLRCEPGLTVREVPVSSLSEVPDETFLNVNRPEDLARLELLETETSRIG